MGTDNNKKQDPKKIIKDMAPYLTLGFEIVIPVVGCFFIGRWIDGKYETEPWWTLILTVYGFITGFYLFFKTVLKSDNNKNKNS